MTLQEILSDLYFQVRSADESLDLIEGIMWRHTAAHVSAEREACAKVCDAEGREWDSDDVVTEKNYAAHCATAIRARGE